MKLIFLMEMVASHVAANTLSKNGLVVLTGAMAAKSGRFEILIAI